MSHEDLVVHSRITVGLTLTYVVFECHRSVVIELLELLRALAKYAGIEPYSPFLTSQPCYSCWSELRLVCQRREAYNHFRISQSSENF